DAL
ncbi:hypothetical protein N7525_011635, partial (mitochondrion) [Penicillium rubens]